MTLQLALRRLSIVQALLLGSSVALAQAAVHSTCDDLPHADHPKTTIENKMVSAVVFTPDTEKGFYRGSRFDWAGIVGCASLNGHVFFGEWFNRYDPTISDAVTGPAEEFRHPTSELGYDEAAPGGSFVKIGVGVLRRLDAKPYSFGGAYPILDDGTWTVKASKRSVDFRQVLHSDIGYGYVYEKTLAFDKHANVLTLTHRLSNTGTKSLDTAVYNHDFFMLDHQPIGLGMELRLPFVPKPDKPLPEAAQIDGKTVRIVAPLDPRAGLGSYITGFSTSPSDFDFTFEDKAHGVGIEETSDSPLVKMYLWATPKTVCPEGYIGIHVAPGQTQSWSIHYRFFTR